MVDVIDDPSIVFAVDIDPKTSEFFLILFWKQMMPIELKTKRVCQDDGATVDKFIQIVLAPVVLDRIPRDKPSQLRVVGAVSILIQPGLGIEAPAGVGIGMGEDDLLGSPVPRTTF
jgi:hypothetical protein